MKVSVVLLSADGNYVSENGELPVRPEWDKRMITQLVTNKRVLCSPNTLKTLPKSILGVVSRIETYSYDNNWDVNFGISTFKQGDADLFIVIKSKGSMEGKRFSRKFLKLTYHNILDIEELELWMKK